MGENISYNAAFTNKHSVITMDLSLVSFVDDKVFFVYCPALDLTGYGNNEDEAQQSFSQTLKMYFEDTIHKNTLFKDLERHGWVVKKQNRLKSPDFDYLFKTNRQLKGIVNNRDFTKYTKQIQFPECVYA